MAKLKVYGGRVHRSTKDYRAIVAATSKKSLAELLGYSIHEVTYYWTETGNAVEIESATKTPGVMLVEIERNKFIPASEAMQIL